jgi:hypothetical protein
MSIQKALNSAIVQKQKTWWLFNAKDVVRMVAKEHEGNVGQWCTG